jgi:hypothetical protein
VATSSAFSRRRIPRRFAPTRIATQASWPLLEHGPSAEEYTLTGYLFAIACVAWATMTVQIAVWMFSAEALARKLRLRSFEATLKQDIAFFDKDTNSTGSLTSSISDNAEKITGLFGCVPTVFCPDVSPLTPGQVDRGCHPSGACCAAAVQFESLIRVLCRASSRSSSAPSSVLPTRGASPSSASVRSLHVSSFA